MISIDSNVFKPLTNIITPEFLDFEQTVSRALGLIQQKFLYDHDESSSWLVVVCHFSLFGANFGASQLFGNRSIKRVCGCFCFLRDE